ncbi:MAG TPA: hypothetical protein VE258_15340 [Ktedonobacterales bacterium]|nr:hypothetical protein [Ktedonobacterales bacterium]
MNQRSTTPSTQPPLSKRDFFDVYKVAIDDLHRTRSLAQNIDTMYVTIVTLLLTADAYEIATAKFDSWVPIVATAGVALIGLAIASRWRRGAANLFKIVTNRYAWLRSAEDARMHPEMAQIGADIFTQEYKAVYEPQLKKGKARASTVDDPAAAEGGLSTFYDRTLVLQRLCPVIFTAVPVILAIFTYINLHPSVAQPLGRLLAGK